MIGVSAACDQTPTHPRMRQLQLATNTLATPTLFTRNEAKSDKIDIRAVLLSFALSFAFFF